MFKELLQELQQTKLVRITGSFADGTQHSNSDIDFRVKPDKPDYRFYGEDRNILKIINILKKFNIKWESNCPGYIYTHESNNNLPIQIEFSDLFRPRKNKLKEVEIIGVKFKTF